MTKEIKDGGTSLTEGDAVSVSVPANQLPHAAPMWKVEPYTGKVHHACLNCGGTHEVAPMDMLIAVGFGCAIATKDGAIVYDEMEVMRGGGEFDDLAELQQIEDMAVADPDHDWRVRLDGPMRGRTYQRHGTGHWVLIDSNEGFA